MATMQLSGGQQLVLDNVDWRSYSRFLRIFSDRRDVRLTYDREVLEIIVLPPDHAVESYLLSRLICTATEELDLPVKGGGSTTLRKRRRRRGLEPDECWWIANEARMRGKKKIDLRKDPPPDLALEIDVTSSSLDRMAIYAVLGVPEVWRYSDQSLTFNVLAADGTYSAVAASLAFPLVAPGDFARFLLLATQQDDNAVVREFRAWVRQNLSGSGAVLEDAD
jgi:Uma2 family endonuclease